MTAQELKEKSAAELNKTLLELRKEQFALNMKKSVGELSRTHLLKQMRRDIARVKTILQQKGANA